MGCPSIKFNQFKIDLTVLFVCHHYLAIMEFVFVICGHCVCVITPFPNLRFAISTLHTALARSLEFQRASKCFSVFLILVVTVHTALARCLLASQRVPLLFGLTYSRANWKCIKLLRRIHQFSIET